MSGRTILKQLVFKDLYLHRWVTGGSLIMGTLAVALLGGGNAGSFHGGVVLLVTALIGLGAYLPLVAVVYERKQQTFPFILSLPVSGSQYVAAKILANLASFGTVWLVLLLGVVAMIHGREDLPNGLIPLATVSITVIFVSSSLLLAVALLTESENWTIAVMVVCNMGFNGFLFYVARHPAFSSTTEGPVAIWSPGATALFAGELASIVLLLMAAYLVGSRRRDFL